jgi:hypothetical protein
MQPNPMPKETIQSILQIVAVISILVGLIMFSMGLIAMVGMQQAIANLSDFGRVQVSSSAATAGLWGLIASATPALWGAILFLASSNIAALIYREQLDA